jgi:hypothetical protein
MNHNTPNHEFNEPRHPLAIDQLKTFLKVGYEEDAPLLLPITRGLFFGYRRCENYGHPRHLKFVQNPDSRRSGQGESLAVGEEWMKLFPECYLFPGALSFSVESLESRFKVLRKRAGLPPWGKDGLRRQYSLYIQNVALSRPPSLLGHVRGVSVTAHHYSEKAQKVWAREYEQLTPLNVLGFQPKPLTVEQMKARPYRKRGL